MGFPRAGVRGRVGTAVATETVPIASAVLLAIVASLAGGCGREAMPSPEAAAREYAEAAERGDGRAIYELMTAEARARTDRGRVERLVAENRKELGSFARAIGAGEVAIETSARLVIEDGTPVALVVEDGGFRLVGAGLVPARATTPEAALAQLEFALRARDLSLLLAALSTSKREEFDGILRALAHALAERDAAITTRSGDRAEVELPGGIRVRLVRFEGAWRVEEIE